MSRFRRLAQIVRLRAARVIFEAINDYQESVRVDDGTIFSEPMTADSDGYYPTFRNGETLVRNQTVEYKGDGTSVTVSESLEKE